MNPVFIFCTILSLGAQASEFNNVNILSLQTPSASVGLNDEISLNQDLADRYNLDLINTKIADFLEPVVDEYPLTKEFSFKINTATVTDTLVSATMGFNFAADKTTWGTSPIRFQATFGTVAKLLAPAQGTQPGSSESSIQLGLSLETDTISLINRVGDAFYSPDECENVKSVPATCAWYKQLAEAKNLKDVKTAFVGFKSNMDKELAAKIGVLEKKLKTLPENSEEWLKVKTEIESTKQYKNILQAINLVEKDGNLSVSVKDYYFDAAKKQGIKGIESLLTPNKASVNSDLIYAGAAEIFQQAKTQTDKYLKAIEKGDEKELKDFKEMITVYVSLALELIVGKED